MDKNVLSTVNRGPSGPMGPVKANTCAYSLLRKALLGSLNKEVSVDKTEKVAESTSNTIVGTVSVAPKTDNNPQPVVQEVPKMENKQEPVHQQQHEYQQNNRRLKPQKRENNNNQENKQQG